MELLALAATFLVAIACRVMAGWNTPLWFDEVYTAIIASQPSFAGLIQDAQRELSGPVYYFLMWMWVKAAGITDASLRIPSLVFSLAAPAVILWKGHEDSKVRRIWAALAALWVPTFYYASEARSYSLLVLLGTLQAIAFLRLAQLPTTRRACLWALVSGLMILTHYYTLAVVGLQGLAYLALHRSAAVRTWPAALLFLPVLGWMSIHIPLLLQFAGQAAPFRLLTFSDARYVPLWLIGGGPFSLLPAALIAITLGTDTLASVAGRKRFPYGTPEMLLVASCLFSAVFIIVMGFLRPSFNPRYLLSFLPGLQLGVALWMLRWGCKWRWFPLLMIAFFVSVALRDLAIRRDPATPESRSGFSWDKASRYLQSAGAKRIFFLVDSSTTETADRGQLARVGGFFYVRDHVPVTVEPVVLAGRTDDPDPNDILLARADRPHDAILWIYLHGFRNTLAMRYPPRLAEIDPRWQCRDFGANEVSVVACVRPGAN